MTATKNAKNPATANAAAATPSADHAPAAPKGVEAFYAKRTEGTDQPIVSIWVNQVSTAGAPDFDGKINDQRVAMRIRKSEKGSFIAITRSLKPAERGPEGYKEQQIGSANIVVNDRGFPILSIHMNDSEKTMWANVSIRVPQELLVKAGLNLKILAEKHAAYLLSKAAKEQTESAPA